MTSTPLDFDTITRQNTLTNTPVSNAAMSDGGPAEAGGAPAQGGGGGGQGGGGGRGGDNGTEHKLNDVEQHKELRESVKQLRITKSVYDQYVSGDATPLSRPLSRHSIDLDDYFVSILDFTFDYTLRLLGYFGHGLTENRSDHATSMATPSSHTLCACTAPSSPA